MRTLDMIKSFSGSYRLNLLSAGFLRKIYKCQCYDVISSDANLPLFGEFRRFCCQKSHFRESSKSVETIWRGYGSGLGVTMHIQVIETN